MNSRLLQFLNAENITQAQFAASIGVARASISHIISGRNKPSYEFISAMMKQYPQLNPEWLILGKGRMYNDSNRPLQQATDSIGDDLLFPTDYDSPASAAVQPEVQMKPVPSRMNSKIFQDGANLESKATPETKHEPEQEPLSQHHDTSATSVVKQTPERRVSKIIVFFDDGTFQEMHS